VLQGLIRERRTTVVAEQLGLSQSAIRHALTRLRALFGDPLFVRRPHGLEPTRHALDLAPRVDALLAAAEEALGLAEAFDPQISTRSFRLASSDFLATLIAPPLLAVFAREAPKARFAFSLSLGEEALRHLRLDEIDLALGRFPRRAPGVQLTPLMGDDYLLVMRRGHAAAGTVLSPEQFAALDFIGVSVGGDFRTFTERAFAERGIARRMVAAAPRFTIAFAMVAAGDAACIAPRRLALAYADAFGLALRDLPIPLPPIEMFAARRVRPDPAVEWLLDVVEKAVGRGG
jgi:DNA-binding transcriptional LysR family regulator